MILIWELERHPTSRVRSGQAAPFSEHRCKNLGIAFGLEFLLDYLTIDGVWFECNANFCRPCEPLSSGAPVSWRCLRGH